MSNLATIQRGIEQSLVAAGVESVLPEHVKMSSFVRCAAIAISQSKDLGEADQDSVIMSLTKCATDGLVPDGKEAALVTFNTKTGPKNNPTWIKKAQYLPMIDGVLKRARMSGQIAAMSAKAVFEGDTFDYWIDEHGEHINYRPTYSARGAFKLAFAFAKLKSGDLIVEVMTLDDVNKVKGASKTSSYGPWVDWFDRMACKAVFHRLARRLPNASEIVEMCEAGMNMVFDKNTEKDITPLPSQYSQIDFEKNSPKWLKMIKSGKKSVDDIITTVEAKGALTETMKLTLQEGVAA